jgi:hypothetical protein
VPHRTFKWSIDLNEESSMYWYHGNEVAIYKYIEFLWIMLYDDQKIEQDSFCW